MAELEIINIYNILICFKTSGKILVRLVISRADDRFTMIEKECIKC